MTKITGQSDKESKVEDREKVVMRLTFARIGLAPEAKKEDDAMLHVYIF